MTELVRGQISDRPWGLTFGQLGLREVTGQLTLRGADSREYRVAFEYGAIVGATSPQPADVVTRIAMTSGLIMSSQVAGITKTLAATPEIDEIALLASAARLVPEQIATLRRRVIAQRAARTFSVEVGTFVLDDFIDIPIAPDAAVDVRAVVLQGARMNMAELRLVTELRDLGSHFTLGQTAFEHADWFAIPPQEMPILEALRAGTTIPELEARHRELDPRSVQAVIYALVACRECEVTAPPAVPRTKSVVPEPVAVSFRRTGDHAGSALAASAEVGVPRTQTAEPRPPRMPTAEEEFRSATGTRTGQPPTRRPYADDSGPIVQRTAAKSIPPPIGDPTAATFSRPRTTTTPPASTVPKGGTAPWPIVKPTDPPRDKPPSIPPPTTSRTISQSGGFSMPRTISQSTGTPAAVYSEGSDRITQSIEEAAEAFRRGIEALHANQLPLAVEQLTRASRLNPHEFEHSAMLAFAQLSAALPGDRPKLADKTRKMLHHASQKSRDPVQAMVYLGQLERLLGNDKQAMIHFRAAIAAKPDHPQAAIELQKIEDKAQGKTGFSLFKKK